MKKTLLTVFLLVLMVTMSFNFVSCGGDDDTIPESSEGLDFKLNSDGESYTLTGIGTCTEVDIIVGLYNELPVTAIAHEAFCGDDILSITISDCVTFIGWSAFEDCSGLRSLTLPESITKIEHFAFRGCDNLTNVVFENTNGWWYANDSDPTSGTEILAADLQNPEIAATYLTSTYRYYHWNCSK